MGNPKKYISPDVIVDFTSFKLVETGITTVIYQYIHIWLQ